LRGVVVDRHGRRGVVAIEHVHLGMIGDRWWWVIAHAIHLAALAITLIRWSVHTSLN
jgi:hypothetical protein